jgi:hypothetical protein
MNPEGTILQSTQSLQNPSMHAEINPISLSYYLRIMMWVSVSPMHGHLKPNPGLCIINMLVVPQNPLFAAIIK